jgi:hypothetical protein
MADYSAALGHVARKIASLEGVEASFIGRDGAIDAVLKKAYDRALREHVIQMGMRAMIPVRVFYRMPDGNIVGEAKAQKNEAIEDFYTTIHVAGFAGSEPSAPPEEIAGDAHGDKLKKAPVDRDDDGQLKLTRIRSSSRGRAVLGWRYGKDALRIGDKVKFKQPCVLQWTMGRTVKVSPGMTGSVMQMSSKSPVAYLSMGGHDSIELPIHAIGHVYDVMVDPKLEAKAMPVTAKQAGLPNEIKRLVMAVGFGRDPDYGDSSNNTAKFRGRKLPDMNSYRKVEGDEDMVIPPGAKNKAPTGGKGDDRTSHVSPAEPRVSLDGGQAQKRILLGRR